MIKLLKLSILIKTQKQNKNVLCEFQSIIIFVCMRTQCLFPTSCLIICNCDVIVYLYVVRTFSRSHVGPVPIYLAHSAILQTI